MQGARRIAAGALALAVLIVLVARLIPDTAPDSDLALIDTYVLHVLRHGFPLGAYSRLGWNHPGPLFFQLLAPLYWLSGYRHLAILLGVASLNAACVIGLLVLLVRRHTTLFVTASVLLFWYFARMDGLLASPWNPHAALMPFALLVVAGAAVGAGSLRTLPVVVFLASLVVQLHAAFLPIAGAIGAVAVAGGMINHRARRSPIEPIQRPPSRVGRRWAGSSLGRTLGMSALVMAVVWIFPLADAVRGDGQHNLQAITHFVRTSTPFDPAAATRMFEHLFVAPFTPGLMMWNGVPLHQEPVVHVVARIEAGLLMVAALTWVVRRRRFEAAFAITVLAASAAAFVAARRVPEAPQEYTMLSVSILGVLSWAAIGSLALDLGRAAVRRVGRDALPRWASLVAAAIVVGFCVRDVVSLRANEMTRSNRNVALSSAVLARLDTRGARSVHIHIPPDYWGLSTAVAQQLYREGIAPTVDADWVSMFGRPFAPTGQEAVTIQFGRDSEGEDDFDHRSTHHLLGRADEFFVYAVDADPAAQPSISPSRLIDRSADVNGAERLIDRTWSASDDSPSSPTAVSFLGTSQFVTLASVEAAPIGLRIWGQPESVWQIRCSADGSTFARAGRVRITAGSGTQSGQAFLKGLATCRQIKVAPTNDGALSWLSEVQVLIGR